VSFAAITLCVASQRVFITVVYFVIDSVRKLLDIPTYPPVNIPTACTLFSFLCIGANLTRSWDCARVSTIRITDLTKLLMSQWGFKSIIKRGEDQGT